MCGIALTLSGGTCEDRRGNVGGQVGGDVFEPGERAR